MSRLSRRGPTVAMAGLLLSIGALSACSTAEPEGPPTLTAQQATSEYLAEAKALTLAPAAAWPKTPIAATAEDGVAMVYEPGFGRQAADSYWFCTWSGRALEVGVSDAERKAAITELDKIRGTYFYTTALAPESKPILDKVLASTRLGDLAPLRRDHEMNCPTTESG